MDRIQMMESSAKWQASFIINSFTQSLAFWISVPVTWFILEAHSSYADAARILSWIVSIYAIGDGLGLYLAKKLYGALSARATISLAIIFSLISSLLYALAGSFASSSDEEVATSIIRHLCTARVLQGICNGSVFLT